MYEALRLGTLGTWRYYKGIYQMTPAMFEALAATDIPTSIPMRVLRHLPEKCLYIDCPVALEGGRGVIYGWFALLDYDYRSGAWELRIVEDNSSGHLILAPFELTEGISLVDTLATYGKEGSLEFGFKDTDETIAAARAMLLKQVEPALKILLYLCSDEPEIDGDEMPVVRPAGERVKRVKGRVRLFEQPKTRVWTVGAETSAAMAAMPAGIAHQGRKTPHVRRAHWHGFWRGPHDGSREFNYKWIPPIVVNEDLIKSE